MPFSNLTNRLQDTFRKLRARGKLTEKDVDAALREVRLALLEADVNYLVVKDFIAKVKERAVGHQVLESLSPGQQVIKIVHEELTSLMGGTQSKINLASKPPTVIMMVGLQGSGKTTTSGKLALHFKSRGHRPLLVAADIYRPAAIKQLMVVGEQVKVPVFSMGETNPVDIAKAAAAHARAHGNDIVIIDTAGRLHIDAELMQELAEIKNTVNPHEILLIVDSMTGQEAVNVASSFDQQLGVDGVILTKLDGDARGGAALSIKSVTGKPIKFAAMSEKMDGLEVFYPDRMASRILGMGDVLSLIEKAEAAFDEQKARELTEKMRRDEFTLEDFREQLAQIKKMGPLDQLLGMIPGMGRLNQMRDLAVDDSHLKRIEAIINSMTGEERRNPDIIGGSRKRRIAAGSGTSVQDVNRLLKQFNQTRQMMRQFSELEKRGRKGKFNLFR
ncbi:MAG: signal recognition particle protein [Limnochordia bacterium]|jgi:signal recognition particle subunit SRP54|nr:signal recognition particle protein [Bacillota bacterium]HOB08416.1 signal recognition particle protein [Limnochordia bacterium]NLH30260.1 signal recognition particle protein [Bacillota bacterium]HPT92217.1 signal recognition particle protein [Limnochordia bacterium]HPZ30865.1 signal recognition particle protein [Limnochordia bacterium]